MAASSVPPRIRWAVEALAIVPEDRLLEIGCGPGLAMALVCELLDSGTITGVDRSARAIEAARKRNAASIAAGKAQLVLGPLADVNLGQAGFNKVYAVNVNLFWLKAARELAVIRRELSVGGTIYLFYDPPFGAKIQQIVERARVNLEAGDFIVEDVQTVERDDTTLLSLVARAHSR